MRSLRNQRRQTLVAIVIALALVGCDHDERPSAEVDTGDIMATYRVRAEGDGSALLTARLSAAGTSLALADGDRFSSKIVDPATGRGERRQLERDLGTLFAPPVYEAEFHVDAAGARIDVALLRPNGRRDALRSAAYLPTSFSLRWVEDPATEMPAAIPYSRAGTSPAWLIWDPSGAPGFEPGDTLAYAVSGTCVVSRFGTIDWAAGEDALAMADVITERASAAGETCDVTVTLELTREGRVDPVLLGGSFLAIQARSITVLTTP